MHMLVKLKDPQYAESLFAGWPETMVWSCLQGVMGCVYGDALERPETAVAFLGDFAFYAGKATQTAALFYPEEPRKNYLILVPQNEQWCRVIEASWGSRVQKITRYATRKEPGTFHIERLKAAAHSLAPGYTLRQIDETLFQQCQSTAWCRDLVSQYQNHAQYERYGLGVAVLKNGELVSGASSYSSYHGGLEIEIDTRADHRRKGLAYACGARLILMCLERGLYPSWDAHNLWSLSLAQKLGYHFDHEYPAYELMTESI